jgi:hypothetical protein
VCRAATTVTVNDLTGHANCGVGLPMQRDLR